MVDLDTVFGEDTMPRPSDDICDVNLNYGFVSPYTENYCIVSIADSVTPSQYGTK